ncbi:hypothetical protein PHYPSEUDO_002159 [Phytophthora pseudosyringae]|uniref:Uncharacterized protein n=1 Tax=Phytophthora pseudosyringae TaxID=221518 RepID=A0A8T1VZ11_9STRA|nr:hypothetical protein PHYPSEUDO_002159 [Phytophthora pseudosyringae]
MGVIHPDWWIVETTLDGTLVPRSNPARSAVIMQILSGLSKLKKCGRTPKRASPMSLVILTMMIAFLESDSILMRPMCVWFSAVSAHCFYSMYGINEVLLMKIGDIQLGLQLKSHKTATEIRFGCFVIRDYKTDHDPLASRTYSLHHMPNEEWAVEALAFMERWFTYARTKLHHM